jgi:hypothetical protein
MKHMHSKNSIAAFFILALFMGGCTKEKAPQDDSVKQGEARSVFVRNNSGIPMTFSVEINGLAYEVIELKNNQIVIYYEPLPVGLPREQVESYKIEGKLTDNFGRSTARNSIEFYLNMGKSEAYPYHPSSSWNGTLTPAYRFTEPLTDWLEEIDAVARKVENLETIHVTAKPIEKT